MKRNKLLISIDFRTNRNDYEDISFTYCCYSFEKNCATIVRANTLFIKRKDLNFYLKNTMEKCGVEEAHFVDETALSGRKLKIEIIKK